MPFFLVYGRDANLPLHQLLEPMQQFLGDTDSGKLNLEAHRLALAMPRGLWMRTILKLHKRQDTTFLQDKRQVIFQKQATQQMGP